MLSELLYIYPHQSIFSCVSHHIVCDSKFVMGSRNYIKGEEFLIAYNCFNQKKIYSIGFEMFFKGCDKKLNCSYGQEHRIR